MLVLYYLISSAPVLCTFRSFDLRFQVPNVEKLKRVLGVPNIWILWVGSCIWGLPTNLILYERLGGQGLISNEMKMSRFMVNGIRDIVILNDVVIYLSCHIMYLWNKILTIKWLVFISLEKSYSSCYTGLKFLLGVSHIGFTCIGIVSSFLYWVDLDHIFSCKNLHLWRRKWWSYTAPF